MLHKTRTLLMFLSTLLFTTSLAKDLCHQDDKNTLLQIQKSLNISWWDPETDCFSWYGLGFDDATFKNRVTSLYIHGQISAQIPPEVGDLPFLKTLIFHKVTNLTGHIPPTITKLKNLTYLWLSWTNLTGPVPEFLSQLKNIEYINLSFNNLSGSIPSSLSSLHKLGYLQLSRNKLTGSIPESFGSFSGKVPDLYLSHNQLSGSIPKSLGNLDFHQIDLSRNKLQGDASMLFGANKTTCCMYLSRNMFQFDISKVERSKKLDILDLNHNGITGSIPVQWTEADFQSLNVSYNRLCGRIPTGGNLQKLDSTTYFHNKCLCGAPLQSCK